VAQQRKHWADELKYHAEGGRRTQVRRAYAAYREEMALPPRCDIPECRFHREALEWNGRPLTPILDHINGVNQDNRPDNLRYLCPNCDSQLETKGGANKGRVRMAACGFEVRDANGGQDAEVFLKGASVIAQVGNCKSE